MADFYEDETGEQTTSKAKKAESKSQPKKQKKKKKPKAKGNGGIKLDIWWVVVVALIVFGVGFVFGHWVIKPSTSTKTQETEQEEAPPLTPEQMEKGVMPGGVPGQSENQSNQ